MKLHTLKYICLLGVMLLLACQHQDDVDGDGGQGLASLTLKLKSVATQVASRAELDDVIDGKRMYRLAVALVDENNTVIHSAQLNQDDSRFNADKNEATVTFERLNYGNTYRLLAVANYGEYDTNTTDNLTNVDNLTGTVNVTSDDESYLCPKGTPYPLSMKKEIVLQPGANTVSGELVRTYARLRINVRNQNQNQEHPLAITGLTLGEKFTQPSVDLFESGGEASVCPNVASEDAITPFVNPTTIEAGSESTIFDAYLLESERGDYTYKLDLEYDGVEVTVYEVASNVSNAINTTEEIENGEMYVIYNTNSRTYLYAGNEKVSAGNSYSSNGVVNPNYVWRFTKTGNGNYYYIESMGTNGYFMQSSKVDNSKVPMVAEKGSDDFFVIKGDGGWWEQYLFLQSTNSNHFLSVDNNDVVKGTNSGDTRRFYLYKVTAKTQPGKVTHTETIPISTINKETGEAIPVTAIKRNDFIHILVNVNYNEKSGKFIFEVADWDEKNGEIIFE